MAGKFEIIWRYPNSFSQTKIRYYPNLSNPTIGNLIWNDMMFVCLIIIAAIQTHYNINIVLRPSGNIRSILKLSGIFWTHQEIYGQLWNPLEMPGIGRYDKVATVPESWVQFPIFKVVLECLKRCYGPFLIYIYGIQCDFMSKVC